jgi:hypothetical protein
MSRFEVYMDKSFPRNDVDLCIVRTCVDGPDEFATLAFEVVPEGASPPVIRQRSRAEPVKDLVQKIIDVAWEHGFRPTGYGDMKNETAAVRAHLEDMRAIAFKKIGVEGPRK